MFTSTRTARIGSTLVAVTAMAAVLAAGSAAAGTPAPHSTTSESNTPWYAIPNEALG